jgi:hypothetical protein
MRTVEAKATVVPMEFPAGTEPGVYSFTFYRDGSEIPEVTANTMVPSCTVSLSAGNWLCSAQRYNDTGETALGNAAQDEFVVPGEATVFIGVVGDVAVSVAEQIKTVKSVTVKGK